MGKLDQKQIGEMNSVWHVLGEAGTDSRGSETPTPTQNNGSGKSGCYIVQKVSCYEYIYRLFTTVIYERWRVNI